MSGSGSGIIIPGRPAGTLNLGYFTAIVRRDHPDWPAAAVRWQAERMFERHPIIEKAVAAGKQIGRDIRERQQHGVGIWWDELAPLTPEERGFVLALVFREIDLDGRAIMPLAQVAEEQAADAYDANESALAAEWAARSAAPDKRVTAVRDMPSLGDGTHHPAGG